MKEQREQVFIQYKKWLYYLGNPRPILLCLCVGCVILSIRSYHLSPRPSFHRAARNPASPAITTGISTDFSSDTKAMSASASTPPSVDITAAETANASTGFITTLP